MVIDKANDKNINTLADLRDAVLESPRDLRVVATDYTRGEVESRQACFDIRIVTWVLWAEIGSNGLWCFQMVPRSVPQDSTPPLHDAPRLRFAVPPMFFSSSSCIVKINFEPFPWDLGMDLSHECWGLICAKGFVIPSKPSYCIIGLRAIITHESTKAIAVVTEVFPTLDCAVLRFDHRDLPQASPARFGTPWRYVLGRGDEIPISPYRLNPKPKLAIPDRVAHSSEPFCANSADLELPHTFKYGLNLSGTRVVVWNGTNDGDYNKCAVTVPAPRLKRVVQGCTGRQQPIRIAPVIFHDLAKCQAASQMPSLWRDKRCHPTDNNAYISVFTASPQSGLLPNDIVVAVNGASPKDLDCFDSETIGYTVIRDSKELHIQVETLDFRAFHSNIVVLFAGMAIQEPPAHLLIFVPSRGLHVFFVQAGSLANSWDTPWPSYLRRFDTTELNEIADLIRAIKAHKSSEIWLTFWAGEEIQKYGLLNNTRPPVKYELKGGWWTEEELPRGGDW